MSLYSAFGQAPRPKIIPGVQFTAGSMTAARIAASQPCNNAWTRREEWEVCANRIRSTLRRLDRVCRSRCEVAILVEPQSAAPHGVAMRQLGWRRKRKAQAVAV